eukprot:Colp12_sorted_trinity150504_noHs@11895
MPSETAKDVEMENAQPETSEPAGPSIVSAGRDDSMRKEMDDDRSKRFAYLLSQTEIFSHFVEMGNVKKNQKLNPLQMQYEEYKKDKEGSPSLQRERRRLASSTKSSSRLDLTS